MTILVNGKPREISAGATVATLLTDSGLNADRVVAELNRAIIARSDFETKTLTHGDELELVSFVGGGFN